MQPTWCVKNIFKRLWTVSRYCIEAVPNARDLRLQFRHRQLQYNFQLNYKHEEKEAVNE